MTKSAYVVEYSVMPGGARRGNLLVCNTPAHVRAIIAWEYAGDPQHAALAADFAAFYGSVIGVWTVQHGKATAFLDLHRYLRARIDGAPPVRLDDEAALEALREKREDEERDFVEAAEFDVDWDGIAAALPALEPPLLAPDETLVISELGLDVAESHLSLADELAWGWNDTEGEDEYDGFPVPT